MRPNFQGEFGAQVGAHGQVCRFWRCCRCVVPDSRPAASPLPVSGGGGGVFRATVAGGEVVLPFNTPSLHSCVESLIRLHSASIWRVADSAAESWPPGIRNLAGSMRNFSFQIKA